MIGHGKLKILQLSTHLNIGGITSYISTAGKELAKRGHKVGVVSGGGELGGDLEAAGLRLHTFSIRTKSELAPKIYFSLPAIAGLVLREKYHIMHAHTRVTQVIAKWVSMVTGVPFVTTAHGYYKPSFGRRFFDSWGKRVVAVGPLVAEELAKSHGVDEKRIRVIANAVQMEELQKKISEKNPAAVRQALGIPESAFVVGSISRLVRDKGHEPLLRAVDSLKERCPDVYLIVLGEGRERKRLVALSRKLGLNGRARFLGGVTDIATYLSAMDVFAHVPTFREGFGLSLAEAMAAKKPVIATDIWAINSILKNNANGILVPPADEGKIAAAIEFLRANPAERARLAEAGERSAAEYSCVKKMVDALESVYREVLAER